ncbi:hypothetical protein T492DRAFT_276873 [Pavlovales sp. CCMP2436]|nr:hypothetical protein T492DRAFT_276873 [Pavlovales sp. CCMP2436]
MEVQITGAAGEAVARQAEEITARQQQAEALAAEVLALAVARDGELATTTASLAAAGKAQALAKRAALEAIRDLETARVEAAQSAQRADELEAKLLANSSSGVFPGGGAQDEALATALAAAAAAQRRAEVESSQSAAELRELRMDADQLRAKLAAAAEPLAGALRATAAATEAGSSAEDRAAEAAPASGTPVASKRAASTQPAGLAPTTQLRVVKSLQQSVALSHALLIAARERERKRQGTLALARGRDAEADRLAQFTGIITAELLVQCAEILGAHLKELEKEQGLITDTDDSGGGPNVSCATRLPSSVRRLLHRFSFYLAAACGGSDSEVTSVETEAEEVSESITALKRSGSIGVGGVAASPSGSNFFEVSVGSGTKKPLLAGR